LQGNGKIDIKEAMAYGMDRPTFKSLDVNSDGVLSKKEIASWLKTEIAREEGAGGGDGGGGGGGGESGGGGGEGGGDGGAATTTEGQSYFHDVDKKAADALLQGKPDGTFLVRGSPKAKPDEYVGILSTSSCICVLPIPPSRAALCMCECTQKNTHACMHYLR
jgi:hypothetical protein